MTDPQGPAAWPSDVSIGGQCPVHYQPLGTCCSPAVRYVSIPKPHIAASSPTPPHPSDIVRARDVLRQRAKAARAEARAMADPNSPAAAALRGKAHGLKQGADLIDAFLQGKWGRRA